MRVTVVLAAAALGLFTLAARADTFQTFDLNATFAGAGSITGTVDLDLSSTSALDSFDSTANLTYTSGGSSIQFSGTDFSFGLTSSSPFTVELTFLDSSDDRFVLALPVTTKGSLAGYSSGFCALLSASPCNFNDTSITFGSSGFNALTGTFVADTSAAPTPEPASMALLGTALLGLAEPIRRRMRRKP